MIDRALAVLIPFFAVCTIGFGMVAGMVWVWQSIPVFVAWVQSSYPIAFFWLSACGLCFSLAASIARN